MEIAVRNVWLALALTAPMTGAELPARYFQLLEAGAAKVEAKLNAAPGADLKTIEAENG